MKYNIQLIDEKAGTLLDKEWNYGILVVEIEAQNLWDAEAKALKENKNMKIY